MKHNLATRPFFCFYFYSWNFSSLSPPPRLIHISFSLLKPLSFPPPRSLPQSLCRPLHFVLAALNLSLSLISLGLCLLCLSVSWYLKPSQSRWRSWDTPRSRLVTKASEDAKDPRGWSSPSDPQGAMFTPACMECLFQHALS